MQAIDVMQRNLVTVSPRDTVIHAAQLMLDHRISGLPVVEADGSLVGIVTEGDLLHRVENDTDRSRSMLSQMFASPTRLAAEFVKSTGRKVRDVMTREPIAAPETALLADIAALFDRHKIRRVPVTRGMALVGIVTRADLLRALVGSGSARAGDLGVVDFR
jgi:CBS domain-containing protein